MKPRAINHHVGYLHADEIRELALTLRQQSGSKLSRYFNICHFVLEYLPPFLEKIGRAFSLELFDAKATEQRARVEFPPDNTRRMFVDRRVWRSAELGGASDRFIVAHEVAHLRLHSRMAMGFSPSGRKKFYDVKEYEAEWQADEFARTFLVPDSVLDDISTASQIAKECRVDVSLVEYRLKEWKARRATPADKLKAVQRILSQSTGDCCPTCTTAMIRRGIETVCPACGTSWSD